MRTHNPIETDLKFKELNDEDEEIIEIDFD